MTVSGLLLSAQERERFAAWLEHEAESDRGMIEQMEKLAQHTEAVEAVRKKLNVERLAALVIMKKLRSVEDVTIG